MANIVFIDYTCITPYDRQTLDNAPLGGTEATVIRVAEKLTDYHQVTVIQHVRSTTTTHHAKYVGIDAWPREADYVITLRNSKMVPFALAAWPKAQHYLWLHDLPTREYNNFINDLNFLHQHQIKLITVSSWHKKIIQLFHTHYQYTGSIPEIFVIYNPIEPEKLINSKPYDPNKVAFFSSPHKGLQQTIELFLNLQPTNPNLKFYYSNPGYFDDYTYHHPNIINLGRLAHPEVIEFIKDAFCVFYGNTIYPETFGLIFAEANALGIPVLCYDLGAAQEVLSSPEQQIVKNQEQFLSLFTGWQNGKRPVVQGRKIFHLDQIINEWLSLFRI